MADNSFISELELELKAIPQLEVITALGQRERFSRDFFDYSPVLVDLLAGCIADIVVRPHSVEEVLAVAKACRRYRTPLTLRGSGTGNYGQSVPLEGGVVMLMGALNKIKNFDASTGAITVESGCLLGELENQLARKGRELRLLPSTWRSASIGGFIAGGSGGIGSVKWGFMRDPGNLLGIEVITLQDQPQRLHLDASSAEALNHAYGTNGIITSLTISTASAMNWQEVIIECADWSNAIQLLLSLSQAAVDLNLCTLLEQQIVEKLPFVSEVDSGNHCLMVLVAPDGVSTLERLSISLGATFKFLGSERDRSGIGLRELSWNHTTLHMRAVDTNWTYLQMLLPFKEYEAIQKLKSIWGDDILWHLEAVRQQGNQRIAALPVVRWRGRESLDLLMNQCKEIGAVVFNPHVITVEDGGLGVVDVDQVEAKRKYDPLGILNPGKLKGWR